MGAPGARAGVRPLLLLLLLALSAAEHPAPAPGTAPYTPTMTPDSGERAAGQTSPSAAACAAAACVPRPCTLPPAASMRSLPQRMHPAACGRARERRQLAQPPASGSAACAPRPEPLPDRCRSLEPPARRGVAPALVPRRHHQLGRGAGDTRLEWVEELRRGPRRLPARLRLGRRRVQCAWRARGRPGRAKRAAAACAGTCLFAGLLLFSGPAPVPRRAAPDPTTLCSAARCRSRTTRTRATL